MPKFSQLFNGINHRYTNGSSFQFVMWWVWQDSNALVTLASRSGNTRPQCLDRINGDRMRACGIEHDLQRRSNYHGFFFFIPVFRIWFFGVGLSLFFPWFKQLRRSHFTITDVRAKIPCILEFLKLQIVVKISWPWFVIPRPWFLVIQGHFQHLQKEVVLFHAWDKSSLDSDTTQNYRHRQKGLPG